jgi:hypothetical protein
MLLLGIAFAAAPHASALPTAPAALALAADQDAPKPSVDINITKTESPGEWYKNPYIIGAGVVILVLLVALASRGGSGTTVVKS